jgi:AraC family ethanolamine operon transcriptional activator
MALSQSMRGWSCVYEPVGHGAFLGQSTELCLWPLQIIHQRMDMPCAYRGTAWPGSLIFVLPFPTEGKTVCDCREMVPDQVTVYFGDQYRSAFVRAPVEEIFVAVDKTVLCGSARAELGLANPLTGLRDGMSIYAPETTRDFRACVTGLLKELETSSEILNSERFRRDAVERLMHILVRMLAHVSGTARPGTRTTTHGYVVEKADSFMVDRLADSFLIADICNAVRVSPRTLRYSFEAVVGVSPTQYLLLLRLNRVREELTRANDRTQIRCIAERYGFCHMGRFAHYYHTAFGERPSETCRRAGSRSLRSRNSSATGELQGRQAACA